MRQLGSLFRVWLGCWVLALLVACGGTGDSAYSGPTLQSIQLTPGSPGAAAGTTTQLNATGIYSDSTHQDLTGTVNWSSSNTAVATVSSAGVVTAVSPGTATVTGSLRGVTVSVTYTVTAAVLMSIEVTPATPNLAAGTSTQLTATGVFSDQSTQNLTTQVVWSAWTPSVASISNTAASAGLVTGIAIGASNISATLQGVSGSTTLTVTPAVLTSIQITPPTPSIAKGLTQQLTATGVFSDNTTQNLTGQVTWGSGTPSVATVGSAGTAGLVTTLQPGTTAVTATLGSVSGNTTVTVSAATLVSIDVTPATPSVAKGLTQQFTATGVYTDNSTQNLTTAVTWSSSVTSVATISNAAGSNGLASTPSTGPATITATLGTISGNTTLTVTPATLVSIGVTPALPSVAKGLTQQFAATGVYTDNSTQNLTTTVTWASSMTSVATISNAAGSNGLASTAGTGPTTITATAGTVSGSTTLTVTPATLVSIEVTPATPSVAKGLTKQFVATGIYTDNSTQNLTTTVTWASSITSVATISNAAGSNGLASTAGTGPTTITATLGAISGNTTLTVTPAALVSIGVTPALPSIAKGRTQQFTAIGVYTDNSTQNLTTAVTWSSSTTSVATISNAAGSNGLASSAGTGPTTITATLGAVSGNTTLTVTPATLVSIQVTPGDPVIANGDTQQFAATGVYTDNSTQDLTATVTWSSSTTSVATISNAAGSNGLASSANTGPTTITATLGTISGNTTLTVTAAELVSIAVTPALPSIAKGLTQQFTATGTYTDHTTHDLTATVTWSSSMTSVATISNAAGSNGLASSAGTGPTTITATQGSISGNTTLTVTAATLVSIAVSPPSASIAKGLTQQFTAQGTYTDQTKQDLTASATWKSLTTSVATISNASGSNGLATGVGTGGPATISATQDGVTGTATLTVTAAVLESISVTPQFSSSSPGSYANGTTQQFTAIGTLSDGTTTVETNQASWTLGNTSTVNIGSITTTGSARGLLSFAPGHTTTAQDFGQTVSVTATVSGISGSTNVQMYESFSLGSSVFSQFTTTCGSCHGTTANPPPGSVTTPSTTMTAQELWYRSDSASATLTFLSDYELLGTSDYFKYWVCTPTSASTMTSYELSSAQCALIQAWANGGYAQ